MSHERKQGTWCALLRDKEILLAMKKRGFGAGKWNGVGGKPDEGETIDQAALRETQEEIGVTIPPSELINRGFIAFHSVYDPKLNWDVHIFIAQRWQGEPTETDEMKPAWFPVNAIPYDQMWPDDIYWLPQVLAGKNINAVFHFNADGTGFDSFEVNEL